MEYMNIRSMNPKTIKSPPLSNNISFNSKQIYNYVLKCLNENKFDEPFDILQEIKAMLR